MSVIGGKSLPFRFGIAIPEPQRFRIMSCVLRELPTNPEIKFRWRFHGEAVAIRKRFWLGFRPPLLNSGHIPIQTRLQLTSGAWFGIVLVNNSESAFWFRIEVVSRLTLTFFSLLFWKSLFPRGPGDWRNQDGLIDWKRSRFQDYHENFKLFVAAANVFQDFLSFQDFKIIFQDFAVGMSEKLFALSYFVWVLSDFTCCCVYIYIYTHVWFSMFGNASWMSHICQHVVTMKLICSQCVSLVVCMIGIWPCACMAECSLLFCMIHWFVVGIWPWFTWLEIAVAVAYLICDVVFTRLISDFCVVWLTSDLLSRGCFCLIAWLIVHMRT